MQPQREVSSVPTQTWRRTCVAEHVWGLLRGRAEAGGHCAGKLVSLPKGHGA